MDANDRAVEIIVNAIKEAVKYSQPVRSDYEGIVKSVNGRVCTVSIDGHNYSVTNGADISFNWGDKCLVHCINGNFNKKIIIAKL